MSLYEKGKGAASLYSVGNPLSFMFSVNKVVTIVKFSNEPNLDTVDTRTPIHTKSSHKAKIP